jgi:hypothetical protein
VIRTGEFTPYANVILVADVVFWEEAGTDALPETA